jgi:hypothetical protein
MLEHLSIIRKKRSEETGLRLPGISRKNLQRKTQKAVKIYKLFEKVGVDNIKCITTYSANSISELTNDKVQDILDNFSKHNDNDNTDVVEVSSHMTEISTRGPGQNSAEVSELIAPIPVTHGSVLKGPSNSSSFTPQIAPDEVNISTHVDFEALFTELEEEIEKMVSREEKEEQNEISPSLPSICPIISPVSV